MFFLTQPLVVTYTSPPSIHKNIQTAFSLETVLIFLRKSLRVRFGDFFPLCILPIAWFSNFSFTFEQLHHTSPVSGGGKIRTRKSRVIRITFFPRQRTKILLAKYRYFYATKIQLGSQLNFTNFTRGSLLAQDSRRNSQGLSVKSSALSLAISAATEKGKKDYLQVPEPKFCRHIHHRLPVGCQSQVQTALTRSTEVFSVPKLVFAEVGCSSGGQGSWTRRTDGQTASSTGLSAFSECWHLPKKRAFRFN